jgi:hypothetical protein
VYVGGEYGGTTDTWGDRTVDGIVEGKYTVTLTKTGFRDVTKEVTINAGQQAKILAELASDPTQQKTSPTQPRAVQLSTGATGRYAVQLSWSQNVDTGFSSYEIYMSTSIGTLGNSVANILSQSTTSYEVNGLNPSTTYYFTVRVWNIVNEFSDSNQVTIATLANDGAPSFALDNSTLIFGIVLVAVVVPVVSAVAVYRRKSNSKADYSKVFAHAERDRLERERAARERVERERVERERRRAEEEREREERQRAEEKWRQNHHNNSYDPFAVLGVPKGATSTQVKAAWRELCKTWHPDMIQGDARVKQMANEKFRSINEAYDEIKRMKGWT